MPCSLVHRHQRFGGEYKMKEGGNSLQTLLGTVGKIKCQEVSHAMRHNFCKDKKFSTVAVLYLVDV
jgi:hypothetical protein